VRRQCAGMRLADGLLLAGPLTLCCACGPQDLEFGIDCDSRVALVGPNGAGEVGSET
jgi:hypothetical protein